MKASIYTLGCKVNQYDTQVIANILHSQQIEVVPYPEKADIYIVNSCTVTASSNQKTHKALRKIKKSQPDALIILSGCMPQAYPEQAKALTEADIILGNNNYDKLPGLINNYFSDNEKRYDITPHKKNQAFFCGGITGFDGRTRAFVKIEDGCDFYCSYCIIPTARGNVRSKPIPEIKKELDALSEKGFLEVVLVGINLSAYGKDLNSGLFEAIKTAASVTGIKRIRLGSLEPNYLNEDILDKLSTVDKLCPQFHISLQSGCDETLKRMNRKYTTEQYFNLCGMIRAKFQNSVITTDVMVGFPGETEDEFNESLAFIKKAGFEKIHVFPYSRREGTKAYGMENQISKQIKHKRCVTMIELGDRIRKDFLNSQIGKCYNVLFESEVSGGVFQGYTDNYITVQVKSSENLASLIREVKIADVKNDVCIGKLI